MPQRIHKSLLRNGANDNAVGANSTTLALTDPVSIGTTGFLAITAAGTDRIHGFSLHSGATSSTNQTVELVKPLYQPWWGVEVVYNTTTAPVASDRGTICDLSAVTSGAITVALATATNSLTTTTMGQLHCLLNDPTGQGISECVFEVAEPQTFADGTAV